MDKIFVNHYVKEIEIGAFQSERGCTQKIEFNVCLEIKPAGKELNDNVDKVLSYEIITESINVELASQRFNLLETLAEKVAERCLSEPRVSQAEVKIEKLDRIPGSLGVCISRKRGPISKEETTRNLFADNEEYSLVNFSSLQIDSHQAEMWVLALINSKKPIVITIEPGSILFNKISTETVRNQVGLLTMDQNAWLLSTLNGRLSVASTKAELGPKLKCKDVVLFCPSQFVNQCSKDVPLLKRGSSEFCTWLAKELNIANLYLVGSNLQKQITGDDQLRILSLNDDEWNRFK